MSRAPERTLPDPEAEPTISVPRAGRAMDLSRSSSYDAAHAGIIPTIRVGKRLLVPTALLRAQLGLDNRRDP